LHFLSAKWVTAPQLIYPVDLTARLEAGYSGRLWKCSAFLGRRQFLELNIVDGKMMRTKIGLLINNYILSEVLISHYVFYSTCAIHSRSHRLELSCRGWLS
jgi:hypothetical protein